METNLPTREQFTQMFYPPGDADKMLAAYSAALTRIEELEIELITTMPGTNNNHRECETRATAAEQRVAKLQNTLTRLEWSGKVAKAPYSMGGPTSGYLPCCPVCRGINPEARWKGEFIASAVGHRELCDMKYQLRGGPAGDAI